MKSYIVAFGISKVDNKLLVLNDPILLENGKIRRFEIYPDLEVYCYIRKFLEPKVFIIYNNDVIIESEDVNNILKNIKFPKNIDSFSCENYEIHKFRIDDKTFYSFYFPLSYFEPIKGESFRKILEKIGVEEDTIEYIQREHVLIDDITFKSENFEIFAICYPNILITENTEYIGFGNPCEKMKIIIIEK